MPNTEPGRKVDWWGGLGHMAGTNPGTWWLERKQRETELLRAAPTEALGEADAPG